MVRYRDIDGFPGYRVGDDGTVWSCWKRGGFPAMTGAWRQLKTKQQKGGYLSVGLKRDGKYHWLLVHRLVLMAFVGPCPEGSECRHFLTVTRRTTR